MGREANILRALLAPLFDESLALSMPPATSDEMILSVARHHRLSPALSVLTATGIAPGLSESFQRDRIVTLGRSALLRSALVEVLRALARAGVPAIILKGLAYEEWLYPIRGTRPANDIDLLVPRAARIAGFDVLRALGYHPISGGPGFDEPSYHEVTFQRGDVFVDLHVGLAPFVRCPIDYAAIWRDALTLQLDGAPAYALSHAHAVVHHALHMAIHHFDIPGIYLVDLARLAADPLVLPETIETARQWRCLRPWQTSAGLLTAFMPPGRLASRLALPMVRASQRVIVSYGSRTRVGRLEQLRRKIAHFDTAYDATRYLSVQGRRVLRERLIGLAGSPSAAARLESSRHGSRPWRH